jgi:3-hydroxyisobutyrate dehydrogenase-like beta-hydroxyacid dehydrogenase
MNAPTVGLVGLGTMGTAIGLRLLEAGARVVATSRSAGSRAAFAATAADAGLERGLRLAASAAEVAA